MWYHCNQECNRSKQGVNVIMCIGNVLSYCKIYFTPLCRSIEYHAFIVVGYIGSEVMAVGLKILNSSLHNKIFVISAQTSRMVWQRIILCTYVHMQLYCKMYGFKNKLQIT